MATTTSQRKTVPNRGANSTSPAASRVHREDADRLHSVAIHLLRQLRRVDEVTGLTAPRLSALSVIVFLGPINLTALAAAEQVRVPSMSRLVRTLEADGLVSRQHDAADGRMVHFEATPEGRRVLHAGRARRVKTLARALSALTHGEQAEVRRGLTILESVIRDLR